MPYFKIQGDKPPFSTLHIIIEIVRRS